MSGGDDATDARRAAEPLTASHPVVSWVKREVVPKLVEVFAPSSVVVFDPPGRPGDAGTKAPGLLVVSSRFEGIAVPDRVALVRAALGSVTPVRPLCLTPSEARLARGVPGPVYAALRTGIAVL